MKLLQPWKDAIQKLLDLKMVRDKNCIDWHPKLVGFTRAAKVAWERFTSELAKEMNKGDFPGHLRGPLVKLRVYGARLALIVQLLRVACGEVDCESVDGTSMTRAACLIEYFVAHTRRVYACVNADRRAPQARKVVRWLRNAKGSEAGDIQWIVSRRDIHRSIWGGTMTVREVDGVIDLLVDHHYLRPLDSGEKKPSPGRRPSPVYAINPAVFGNAESPPEPFAQFAFSHNSGDDHDPGEPVETPFDEDLGSP
jgi:hypothetical protein